MAGCHPSWVDRLVAEGANDTGAQFEDRCAQVALRLFWEGSAEEGTTPDSLPTRWVMADDHRCQAGNRRAPQLKAQLWNWYAFQTRMATRTFKSKAGMS